MEGSAGGTVLAAVFFLLFQLCGLCVSRAALPGEGAGTRLLFGSVCGVLLLQWTPIPFAFFLGFSQAAHLCAAALALLLSGACLWWGKGKPGFSGALSAFGRNRFLWAVLLFLLFFAFLVWRSFLFRDGAVYSSQATYGDMSMHLSFITSLARQQKFPPDYSLLPDFRLSYPFLSDSVSASLYLLGAPLKLAYALPMLFAGAQVLFGFYLFAARMLKSGRRAAVAWVLFFFNGGQGFLYFLGSGEDFARIFTDFYRTPTNLMEENIRWVNVVVDMMLPQRATLFGWAVLFPVLYLLYRAAWEGERRYFLYAGVLGGLLPMVHTHSFLALALVCGAWLLSSLLRGLSLEGPAARVGKQLVLFSIPALALAHWALQEAGWLDSPGLLWAAGILALLFVVAVVWLAVCQARQTGARRLLCTWGVLLLAACGLALPQLCFWTFRQAGQGGFVRGHFGWAVGNDPYLWFYLKNIGLAGLLALGGLLTVKGGAFLRYTPAPVIWLLAELVEFQPNDYDNNKLLYVAFAFLCCAAAEFSAGVLEKLKNGGLRAAVVAVGFVLCTASAVLTMGREAVARYELFGEGALSLCGWVEENLPADAVVLTDTRHNNEIAALAGRNVVCGSPSYLYYHGLPYAKSQWAVEQMYQSPAESRELFREFGVDYVLISDFERSSYQVDEPALLSLFPVAYEKDGIKLLAVRQSQ